MGASDPTGTFDGSGGGLPLEEALLLEEACDAFEAAWQAGGRPDVDAAVLGLPQELRAAALRELVSLDAHYRHEAGEHPAAADYADRFPDLDPDWLAEVLGARDPVVRADGGYELLGEIDRGGMGVVLRATDLALDRPVAIKTLHPGHPAADRLARRFVREARITGRLQHPGIPAVHGLGTLPDGRPFLAMKLVPGGTLEQLLTDRPDPSHDRGRFVAVFEQICQAVGYAHAHQVVHRDLTPRNVMVGAFGEVQVMDWGLAKVLTEAGPTEPGPDDNTPGAEVRSPRDPDDATRDGTEIGTAVYMSREQAIGAISQIDERSDVFGLGAILRAILTGDPPYVAPTREDTRQMAAEARLEGAFARLDGCEAEPALVALCKRCLAAGRPLGRGWTPSAPRPSAATGWRSGCSPGRPSRLASQRQRSRPWRR
jgi:serine/threonine protein kinase